MSLTGLSSVCRKASGGTARLVKLLPISEMIDVVFDTPLQIEDFDYKTDFVELSIVEDSGLYTEVFNLCEGVGSVEHTLKFSLDWREGSTEVVAGLIAESAGLVALVELADRRKLLVGWSQKFGGERPLRVTQMKVNSGSLREQQPVVEVTLQSVDTDTAANY